MTNQNKKIILIKNIESIIQSKLFSKFLNLKGRKIVLKHGNI